MPKFLFIYFLKFDIKRMLQKADNQKKALVTFNRAWKQADKPDLELLVHFQ